jgi:lysophosphatidate acyltransferase
MAISVFLTIIAIPMRLLGAGAYSNFVAGRVINFTVGLIGGLRFKVIGEEYLDLTRPCVFVSNHQVGSLEADCQSTFVITRVCPQSTLDMATMGRVFPKSCVVMGKKEITRIPFFGWYFMAAGNFPIDRKNHAAAIDTMGHVAERMMNEKVGLWLYPEGTRSFFRTPDLLDFKKGAFRTAIDCQCPIVPVVFSVYTHVFDEKARRWPGGTVTIKVLPPIETKGMTADDSQKLLDTTRDQMLGTLKQISGTMYRNTITSLDVGDEDDHEEVPGKKKSK